MRAVIQRVLASEVLVEENRVGKIGKGFNVLVGIKDDDTEEDMKYILEKIKGLRVFEDSEGKMNLSLQEVGGQILLISQFTLYGDARKGRRPSFIQAAKGEDAERMYQQMIHHLRESGYTVETGVFGAEMKVLIENDGPVTILLDSRKTF
ncbi:D-aminoacyl-tRNA deacylase [Proteiniclasticum ruminis]|uniref:D-aminoacyl-tRNA deacylase n=1 Tax=Proteiniclasticum ruminis TaxID=398199 RepID=A0A1G8GC79_9CLOT|nr:D-aminoacyl-tRNA deacylase [Proteiniclasticum ruminis]MBP9920664.1 D-tyrosyl-tRNA(Tyr) deacylase [Proteiniclasticum sp.]SDH91979.1 D-tyrosyl-tRNA(Tyr) deacylase [Proteiniclasticum ruminis]